MGDLRSYPEGSGAQHSRYINDVLVDFGLAKILRKRATIAEVNAGLALLPALPGVKWRLLDADLLAVGGAVAAATTVDITGTLSGSSRKLLAVAVAALTQSALVRAGAANATLLADGASFTANDANTAINISKTGSTATTATHVDVFLTYVADEA